MTGDHVSRLAPVLGPKVLREALPADGRCVCACGAVACFAQTYLYLMRQSYGIALPAKPKLLSPTEVRTVSGDQPSPINLHHLERGDRLAEGQRLPACPA